MIENSKSVQTHSIIGVDSNYLRYVEIIDLNDTGEYKWFVKDSFNNTTPVFDNIHDFIAINDKKCMFLGNYNGKTNLFVVEGSHDNPDKLYDEIELEGSTKRIIDVDSKKIIIVSDKGIYFFDKDNLKKSSDLFDRISIRIIDNNKVYIFEKEVKDEDRKISNKIIGVVTNSGKIGDFVYDESIRCLRSTPKINIPNSYDLLNTNILYKELEELYFTKKREEKEYSKRLVRINNNMTKHK